MEMGSLQVEVPYWMVSTIALNSYGETSVYSDTEAFVHGHIVAWTNGASAHQKGWSRLLYKLALSDMHQNFLLQHKDEARNKKLKACYSLWKNPGCGKALLFSAFSPAAILQSQRANFLEQISFGLLQMQCHLCDSCRAPLQASDGHSCLGHGDTEAALTETDCSHCESTSLTLLHPWIALLQWKHINALPTLRFLSSQLHSEEESCLPRLPCLPLWGYSAPLWTYFQSASLQKSLQLMRHFLPKCSCLSAGSGSPKALIWSELESLLVEGAVST